MTDLLSKNKLIKPKINYVNLYQTTPWYNFNSYLDCCYSLGIRASINSYIRYNNYYKTLFVESND